VNTGSLYLVGGILGLTVTVFATRSGFYLLPARFELPHWAERILRYAPGCALAGVIAPALLNKGGDPSLTWNNHELVAALVAGTVFVKWRNMMGMITIGLLVFTALRLWA